METVYIRHPDIDGDPVPVPKSSVPHHTGNGWQVVGPPARTPRRGRGLTADLAIVDEVAHFTGSTTPPPVTAPVRTPRATAKPKPSKPADSTTQED